MAHDEKAVAFEAIDLEAQAYPDEKLLSSTTGSAVSSAPASTPLTPHPILPIRGIWTLIRPSYYPDHNLANAIAILLFWHYFGPTVNFI